LIKSQGDGEGRARHLEGKGLSRPAYWTSENNTRENIQLTSIEKGDCETKLESDETSWKRAKSYLSYTQEEWSGSLWNRECSNISLFNLRTSGKNDTGRV